MQTNTKEYGAIYYRLVAVWVICEAFAGGLFHSIKLPFSGLLISSLAVTCIVLIAWHVPMKGAIFKATVIVAIFKLMLSPHSPPTAYIAVFFQGLMGELLFSSRKFFKASSIALAIISLVESSIQRILVLVIIYGNGFWKAMNQFIQRLTGDKQLNNYSLTIAGVYILIHAVAGVLVGLYTYRLVKRQGSWQDRFGEYIITERKEQSVFERKKKKNTKRIKLIFIILWCFLLLLLLQSYLAPGKAFISTEDIGGLILRSVLVVLSWYLFVGPLLMLIIKRLLRREQAKQKPEIHKVMELLPETRYIFTKSWELSASATKLRRVRLFVRIFLLNILRST